jgi:shikimate dehydrogenase
MVLGAGRLARVISVALADAGVAAITVASRNESAGQQLAKTIGEHTGAAADFVHLGGNTVSIEADAAVLVNATSLGTSRPEARLPLNPDSLGPKLVVAEVAYNTPRTWLTQQAAERGCRVVDGLSLYVQQTALALRVWTGVMADTVAMRDAAEEFLGI